MLRTALRTLLYWFLAFDLFTARPMMALHEACHYAAARLMGYHVKYSWYRVQRLDKIPTGSSILVRLAPALVGAFIALVVGVIAIQQQWPLWAKWVYLGFVLWWHLLCIIDVGTVLYFCIFRHWPTMTLALGDQPFAPVSFLRTKHQ